MKKIFIVCFLSFIFSIGFAGIIEKMFKRNNKVNQNAKKAENVTPTTNVSTVLAVVRKGCPNGCNSDKGLGSCKDDVCYCKLKVINA